MTKKYFLLFSFVFFVAVSFGQHCRYDGTSMIMLDISKSPSIEVKNIYLLDSTGAIVINKHYGGDRIETDSTKFWKNPARAGKENTGSNIYGRYFPFAKSYQIVAFGGTDQPKPYRVLITYKAGGTTFHKNLPLLNNHIHSLCTNNEDLWNGRVKPMSVLL